jgi:hypothetical protein
MILSRWQMSRQPKTNHRAANTVRLAKHGGLIRLETDG